MLLQPCKKALGLHVQHLSRFGQAHGTVRQGDAVKRIGLGGGNSQLSFSLLAGLLGVNGQLQDVKAGQVSRVQWVGCLGLKLLPAVHTAGSEFGGELGHHNQAAALVHVVDLGVPGTPCGNWRSLRSPVRATINWGTNNEAAGSAEEKLRLSL